MEHMQEIQELVCAPGRLEFDARIGERTERLWFDGGEATPTADAALIACLMPAMTEGGTLEVPYPVSPRLLRNQREYQAVQAAWSLDWDFGSMPLNLVDVRAPARAGDIEDASGRVAAFFSGGVDSWVTVLDNPDVTDLVFIRGFDLMFDAPHQADLVGEVEERLRSAAAQLGRTFHVVQSNLRQLSDPLLAWETYFGAANVAVAHYLAPSFDRVLIANDSDYEVQEQFGISGLVHQALSSESLEILEAAGRYSRLERVRRIAAHPVVRRSLRVCWENRDGAYNCGHCPKCLLTMCELEVAVMYRSGSRERRSRPVVLSCSLDTLSRSYLSPTRLIS